MPDIQIDDGLHAVMVDGQEYRIDLVSVANAITSIVSKHRTATDNAYLTDFADYMREQWGMNLAPGQALQFWRAVNMEIHRQKKEYIAALNSPSSTDSTPEEPEE